MALEAVMVVMSGSRRYAMRQEYVRSLGRAAAQAEHMPLAAMLGLPASSDESYVVVGGDEQYNLPLRVQHANLPGSLPDLPLPHWLVRQSHPAVCGLVCDGDELIPLIDLVQLALYTGRESS